MVKVSKGSVYVLKFQKHFPAIRMKANLLKLKHVYVVGCNGKCVFESVPIAHSKPFRNDFDIHQRLDTG